MPFGEFKEVIINLSAPVHTCFNWMVLAYYNFYDILYLLRHFKRLLPIIVNEALPSVTLRV